MYRYGYFIYALYIHNILEKEDVQNFCSSIDFLIDQKRQGFHSLPYWDPLPGDHGRFMTRDDYQGMLLGLYFAKRFMPHSDASKHIKLLNQWFDTPKGLNLKEGEIWGPWHEICFERADGQIHNYYATWDMLDYTGGAKVTCSRKGNESNKLLRMTCIIIARYETPTYWSEASDEFCHDSVNFNNILDIYYGNDPLGKLLKDII